MRLTCIKLGTLHAVDEGVASHSIGNAMWECITRRVFGGRNIADATEKLRESMKAWYKGQRGLSSVQGKLTVARIRTQGGRPTLKAKAASTSHLAAWALGLARDHQDGSDHDRRRLGVCQSLCNVYDRLEAAPMLLPDVAKHSIGRVGLQLCVLYSQLASEAAAQHVKLWKMSPKLHLFLHLCEWQACELGNPRFCWCYADEDLVGKMIDVAETCHPSTMAVTAMFKWMHVAFD